MDGRGREWGSRTEEGEGGAERRGRLGKDEGISEGEARKCEQHEAKGEEAKGREERRVKMTPLTGCT